VLAIMPHPERANWAWQLPDDVGGRWGAAKRGNGAFVDAPGPGRKFFATFAHTLKGAAA
jgi:hypothetical protein